ncbi:MAG: EamA family transporter RarD [Phycisphaerae bacterium]|nr:EamA family transporter RarD [Phycisphaerae bacterium]
MNADSRSARAGVLYALGAYGWWGFVGPLYFRSVDWIPAWVIASHRVFWSIAVLAVLVVLGGQLPQVAAALAKPRIRAWLLLTTVLLGINWFVFIVAVASHRLVESSIGYFISPLVTVMLGVIFLRERLRRAQVAAVLIAGAGLVVLAISREVAAQGFPWIPIVLPLSFGAYGLVRKQLAVAPLAGLAIETALLAIPGAIAVAWFHSVSSIDRINDGGTWLLLSLSGVVTTLPMLWFVAAAKRLTLTTLGFLQFLSPALQLLVAVMLFGEPFTPGIAAALLLIAAGVTIDLAVTTRRTLAARGVVP